MVLEKDEENKLDWSCEKLSIANNQGEQEYPTNHKMKAG